MSSHVPNQERQQTQQWLSAMIPASTFKNWNILSNQQLFTYQNPATSFLRSFHMPHIQNGVINPATFVTAVPSNSSYNLHHFVIVSVSHVILCDLVDWPCSTILDTDSQSGELSSAKTSIPDLPGLSLDPSTLTSQDSTDSLLDSPLTPSAFTPNTLRGLLNAPVFVRNDTPPQESEVTTPITAESKEQKVQSETGQSSGQWNVSCKEFVPQTQNKYFKRQLSVIQEFEEEHGEDVLEWMNVLSHGMMWNGISTISRLSMPSKCRMVSASRVCICALL